jgi:hypothetical protein
MEETNAKSPALPFGAITRTRRSATISWWTPGSAADEQTSRKAEADPLAVGSAGGDEIEEGREVRN